MQARKQQQTHTPPPPPPPPTHTHTQKKKVPSSNNTKFRNFVQTYVVGHTTLTSRTTFEAQPNYFYLGPTTLPSPIYHNSFPHSEVIKLCLDMSNFFLNYIFLKLFKEITMKVKIQNFGENHLPKKTSCSYYQNSIS
jgi:hypothetical protein